MSLRDELIAQQQKLEDEKKRKAEELLALEKQKKKDEKQKMRDNADAYTQLEKDIENGNAPEEFVSLYNKYAERIKSEALKGKDSFLFSDEISEEYFNSKLKIKRGFDDERSVLISYIIDRLENDGFYNIKFDLTETVVMYETDSDRRANELDRESAEREAKERYDSDYLGYLSTQNGFDGYIKSKPDPYSKKYEPKVTRNRMTGRKKVYLMKLECSLNGVKRVKGIKQKGNKSKAFLICSTISFIALIASAMISGYLFVTKLEWHIVPSILAAIGVGALAAGIINGLALLLTGNKDVIKKLTK